MPYTTLSLKVSKTNMLQNLSIFAPAPVFAAVMAMHALDKRMENIGVRGVGILHQNATPWMEHMEKKGGYLQTEMVQRRGATLFDPVSKPLENPMQPMALADLEWTLLLAHDRTADEQRFQEALSTMRLAGGEIRSLQIAQFETMDAAMGSLRSGFWMDDATHLLAASENPMKALLQQQRNSAWMVPVNLGYALLESPKERRGARDGLRHAFAEHMIGLVQYRSIRKVRTEITEDRLWRWRWENDQFFVSNHHPWFEAGSTAINAANG